MVKIAFFGSSQFSLPILKTLRDMPVSLTLVVTKFPDVKNEKTPGYAIAQLAKERNIPLLKPQHLSEEAESQFHMQEIDLAILASYGNIIPETLLFWPRLGWLNVHPSLLPAYRGATPIQSAIQNGENVTGVTLMKMDAGIDTGPIISQERMQIPVGCTAGELTELLAKLSAKMIQRDLLAYIAGTIEAKAQQNLDGAYTKKISKEDAKIRWQESATAVWNHIRACTPEPGAWTHIGSLRVEILSGIPIEAYQSQKAGQLVVDGKRLSITCGHNSALQIVRVKVSGKKECDASAFLNGYRHLVGLYCM